MSKSSFRSSRSRKTGYYLQNTWHNMDINAALSPQYIYILVYKVNGIDTLTRCRWAVCRKDAQLSVTVSQGNKFLYLVKAQQQKPD